MHIHTYTHVHICVYARTHSHLHTHTSTDTGQSSGGTSVKSMQPREQGIQGGGAMYHEGGHTPSELAAAVTPSCSNRQQGREGIVEQQQKGVVEPPLGCQGAHQKESEHSPVGDVAAGLAQDQELQEQHHWKNQQCLELQGKSGPHNEHHLQQLRYGQHLAQRQLSSHSQQQEQAQLQQPWVGSSQCGGQQEQAQLEQAQAQQEQALLQQLWVGSSQCGGQQEQAQLEQAQAQQEQAPLQQPWVGSSQCGGIVHESQNRQQEPLSVQHQLQDYEGCDHTQHHHTEDSSNKSCKDARSLMSPFQPLSSVLEPPQSQLPPLSQYSNSPSQSICLPQAPLLSSTLPPTLPPAHSSTAPPLDCTTLPSAEKSASLPPTRSPFQYASSPSPQSFTVPPPDSTPLSKPPHFFTVPPPDSTPLSKPPHFFTVPPPDSTAPPVSQHATTQPPAHSPLHSTTLSPGHIPFHSATLPSSQSAFAAASQPEFPSLGSNTNAAAVKDVAPPHPFAQLPFHSALMSAYQLEGQRGLPQVWSNA